MTLICVTVSLVLLVRLRHKCRGTTLMAPWCWAATSLFGWAVVACLGLPFDGSGAAIRYGMALLTHCPVMAVLGAKRPQDRGWQLIVFSLWLVQLLPTAQFLALTSAGAAFRPDFAWRHFGLILIAVGFCNWIFTRFWPSCALFTASQLLLLTPLPTDAAVTTSVAAVCLLVSITLISMGIPRSRWVADRVPNDRWWFDFRDAFGAVWGLRVAERLNAAARAHRWPALIRWNGYEGAPHADGAEADSHPAMQRCIKALLRRFVSPDWTGARQE